MKQVTRIITVLLLTIVSITTFGQDNKELVKEKFKVYGNCEMCKTKIETTVKSIEGVEYAKWNLNTLKLKIKYDDSKTDLVTIKKEIALVGYDTKEFRATEEAYNKLHSCCKYLRPKPLKNK